MRCESVEILAIRLHYVLLESSLLAVGVVIHMVLHSEAASSAVVVVD